MSNYKYQNEVRQMVAEKSLVTVATAIGVSDTAVSRYVNGKYNGNLDNLENKIGSYLSRVSERGDAWSDIIVNTSVMDNVMRTIRLVHNMRVMGLITGPAGIGKTKSCEAYQQSNPGVILVTASVDGKSIKGIVSDLYWKVAGKELRGTARAGRQAIINRLKGADRAILIDEAHKLVNDSYQELKHIYDQTGCPIILVGTHSVYDRLVDERYGHVLEEVDDRIPIKRRFNIEVPKNDIVSVAQAYGVYDKGAIKKLVGFCRHVSIRKVAYLVKMARFLANGEVTEKDIIDADMMTRGSVA